MSGAVIAIGGHEDREGDRVILRAVAAAMPRPRLAVVTIASQKPAEMIDVYRRAFDGIVDVIQVHADDRLGADDDSVLDGVGGVFLTGGDQLRLTSILGQTALERAILDRWREGCVVAGTSAGASVLTETMIVRGDGAATSAVGDVELAAGLGILPALIIDQHFAERGRIGRLVAAITQNPRLIGLGIDEDTAVVVRGETVEVIGSGSVTALDAAGITATNLAEGAPDAPLSVFDLCGHVLVAGDRFDLDSRRPSGPDDAD